MDLFHKPEEKTRLLEDNDNLIYSVQNNIKLLKNATLDLETIKLLEKTYDLIKKLKDPKMKEQFKMEIRDISKTLKEKQLNYKKMEKITYLPEENLNINSDCDHIVVNVIDENFNVDISESSTDMKSVHEDINDLYDVYKNLSVLVNEQGEILDRIDYNIEQTETDVEQGNKDIIVAHKKKKKRKIKILIIVSIIIILLVFVGILVYFTLINKK